MRYVLMLAVCFAVATANLRGSYQGSPQNQKKSPEPTTINVDTVNVNKLKVAQQKDPTQPHSYIRSLFSPELLPNTVLGIVGIFGIPTAIWTLIVIKRQTNAILASVQLQELNLRQWVTLDNWAYTVQKGETKRLNILFDVKNPTQIPFDLDLIYTKVDSQECSHGAVSWLTPNNPYTASVTIILNDDEMTYFESSKLTKNLRCSVFYRDALQRQWEQIMDRLLVFRQGAANVFVLETRTQVRDSTPTKASIKALDTKS